jgi:hypothetical protein
MIHTARTLARRWHCTPQTIYNLRAQGRLQGFKLGGKLWRITEDEIIALEGSKADGVSCGKKADADTDGALSQKMRLKRALHSETLPENVTRLHGQQGE